MSIKKRILQYLDIKGVTKYQFYKETGVSRGVLDQPSGMSEDNTASFIAYASDVNIEWLITGQGQMLKNTHLNTYPNTHLSEERDQKVPQSHTSDNENTKRLNGIYNNERLNAYNEATRPRIPMNAVAGSLSVVAQDGVTKNDCEQIPVVKAFSRYDFTIFAQGDSMEPEYRSGDELACLFIRNPSYIQWGRCFVLDTSQGVILKRVFDGDDCFICKSDNQFYKDFPVPKTEVYNIALVVGLIRRY